MYQSPGQGVGVHWVKIFERVTAAYVTLVNFSLKNINYRITKKYNWEDQ